MIKASLAQAPVMMLAYPIDTIKTRLQIPFGAASSSSTQLCNTEQTPRQLTPVPEMHLANSPLYSMHLCNAPSTSTPYQAAPFPTTFPPQNHSAHRTSVAHVLGRTTPRLDLRRIACLFLHSWSGPAMIR